MKYILTITRNGNRIDGGYFDHVQSMINYAFEVVIQKHHDLRTAYINILNSETEIIDKLNNVKFCHIFTIKSKNYRYICTATKIK